MRGQFLSTLVTKVSRNQQQYRNLSHISIPMLLIATGTIVTGVGTYSAFTFGLLKEQLLPLQQGIDRLEMNTKKGIDKLEMKLDGLSKEIKDSNDKMNSRIDSALRHSLDSPKPAGE